MSPFVLTRYVQPASYWYLRGFNLKDLEPSLDWFNIMTYDIRTPSPAPLQLFTFLLPPCCQTNTYPSFPDGTWDSTVRSIGSFAYAHTNLTEINMGLELLWRNNVNPERVNLGLGFYGRSMSRSFPLRLSQTSRF